MPVAVDVWVHRRLGQEDHLGRFQRVAVAERDLESERWWEAALGHKTMCVDQ